MVLEISSPLLSESLFPDLGSTSTHTQEGAKRESKGTSGGAIVLEALRVRLSKPHVRVRRILVIWME